MKPPLLTSADIAKANPLEDMFEDAELRPGLERFIVPAKFGGEDVTKFVHPLHICYPYDPHFHKQINARTAFLWARIREERKKLRAAMSGLTGAEDDDKDAMQRASKAIVSIVHHVEKPYRIWCFYHIAQRYCLHSRLFDFYWRLLADLWVNVENIWQNHYELEELIWPGCVRGDGPFEEMMDEDEIKAFKWMPDPVTVYRGCTDHNKAGYSWTVDYGKAVWFARRLRIGEQPCLVVTGKVEKDNVVAYLEGRSESEIVTHPDDVDVEDIKDVGCD